MTPEELRETAENYRRGELTPLCEILPAMMDRLAAVMDRIEDVNSELETVRDRKTPLPSMTTDGPLAPVYGAADAVDEHLRAMKARRQFGGGIGVEK
jgi:hypothetical protein